ncbi:MAG TPA: DUF3748 domain-containing protein, partial [Candidatus Hydrogenedens sp.]|nr:DUF3748 domain-containing protein [Candidatus Hydrogenedens sp.]
HMIVIDCFFVIFLFFIQQSEAMQMIESINLPIRQLTHSSKNHELDNNDNFSFDDKYLCYDTRGTLGYGIENCVSIEVVDINTGKEYIAYQPQRIRLGMKPAPGVGAVSFHPEKYKLVFIHGPNIENLDGTIVDQEVYAKTNRRGAIIDLEKVLKGEECLTEWVDKRMVDCNMPIINGAHRGGTHRHEYSANGKRIGCTYDDWLLPQYGRTIAYFEQTDKFIPEANYHFAVLVKVVPMDKANEGDFVKALGDSWIGPEGKQRAFIGTIKEGNEFVDYLCVVEIPDKVDIQSSNSGDCDTYPEPPQGLKIHKITKVQCSSIVRASNDGKNIAYLDKDPSGKTQIFIIKLKENEDNTLEIEPAPIQVTFLPEGVEDNLRWHPSGKSIFSISEGAIVSTCVEAGKYFGKSVYITPQYKINKPYALVPSRNGKMIAFNRSVPTYDENGIRLFSSEGKDFSQIFLLTYHDENNDGIPEGQ